MAKKKLTEEQVALNLKLPRSMIDRLDAYIASSEVGGTKKDAVMSALELLMNPARKKGGSK